LNALKPINLLAIVVVVASISIGTALGLFVQTDQPKGQVYSFAADAVQTADPTECGTIPKNYSEWLSIYVIGNRTAMSFASVSVYDPGDRITIDLPLNGSANVAYRPMNSSFEAIIVPLPQYFNPSDVLSLGISYSISTYPSQSQTLTDIPITRGNLTC
jgi:hypothetical protein